MRKGYKPQGAQSYHRLNHQITAREVRLLDASGKQIGVMPISDALKLATEETLDLVEIAGQAVPPVVKLIDYRKFLYQEKKKKQEEKRNAHITETKQIRFGPFINDYDLGIKLNRAREFISDGDKVKFIVRFQGRAITKQDLGRVILEKVINQMADTTKVDRDIHMEGRQMIVVLTRGKIANEREEENAKKEIESKKLGQQTI